MKKRIVTSAMSVVLEWRVYVCCARRVCVKMYRTTTQAHNDIHTHTHTFSHIHTSKMTTNEKKKKTLIGLWNFCYFVVSKNVLKRSVLVERTIPRLVERRFFFFHFLIYLLLYVCVCMCVYVCVCVKMYFAWCCNILQTIYSNTREYSGGCIWKFVCQLYVCVLKRILPVCVFVLKRICLFVCVWETYYALMCVYVVVDSNL